MSAIKAIFGWIFRNAILFVLIVAALIAHAVWTQSRADERSQEREARAELASLEQTRTKISEIRHSAESEAAAANEALQVFAREMRGASIERLAREITATRQRLSDRSKSLPSSFEETRQVVSGDIAALADTALTRIEIARLERQLAFLEESIDITRSNRSIQDRLDDLNAELASASKSLEQAEANCNSATLALKEFDEKWIGAQWISGGRRERRTRAAEKTAACFTRDAARTTRDAIKHGIASAETALINGEATIDTTIAATTHALEELERQSEERQRQLAGRIDAAGEEIGGLAERYEVARTARSALLILLGIIAVPFLIRTLFYYVIAPFAERRAAIRITVPGTGDAPLPPAEPSRISIPVILGPGEELLVRQDYLQTSPMEADKATRWLLDITQPLSSIATGLVFLTRIRGGGSTTVSAVKDPFAELAQISLPRGASCVLHPRALVALVQPVGKTLRITSHWRLFSLNAWLTMQLRFMVFHGPGRLIVKGGRGVRIETAEAGRIFGQDQLIGFSADLAYSVTRTETFAPYLFGREQLFKDKVEEGGGVLVLEEAPFAGRSAGEVRRGLEGAFDAGMKVFGL